MKQWYTFYTKPNSERLVVRWLEDQGFNAYFPQLIKKNSGGSSSPAREPLFPCYLFAEIDLAVDAHSKLRWLPGLRSIIGIEGTPLAVPGEIIERLKDKVNELNAARIFNPHVFRNGDQVRIVKGPFEDLLATFDRPLPSLKRVQILMKILGQVRRVKISPASLELASDSGNIYNKNKRARRTRGKGRFIKTT